MTGSRATGAIARRAARWTAWWAARDARPGRGWALYYAAVAATTLLVVVAAFAVRDRWRQECAAAQRALNREMLDAVDMAREWADGRRRAAELVLVASVYGLPVEPGSPGTSLDRYERFTHAHLLGLGLAGDPGAGVFRLPLTDGARLETRGAAGDPGVRAALRAHLARRRPALLAPEGAITRTQLHAPTPALDVVYARECDLTGRPLAVVGVTYSGRYWDVRLVRKAVAILPLLPPSFAGVDWETGRWVARDASGRPIRAAVGEANARHNRLLGVTLRDPTGAPIYQAGPRASVGEFGAVADVNGLLLEVALPAAHGRRLVAAATPQSAERWLLGGVTVLAGLFAAGAMLGVRRQHRLAEARRNFVAAVSHELRTPVAHLALLSETLLGPAARQPAQRRRWLAAMHREALRLGQLVDNALLVARGEQRELTVERRWADAAEVARNAATSLAGAAAARGARIHVEAPDRCPAYLDPDALRHVLRNVLDNALKYGPDGQRVVATLAPARPGGALVITVDDEGTGVPAADRARVWAPFARLGDRGGATGGSGLGLAVVRELVRLHGGRAWLEGAPGGGARVAVTLPQPAFGWPAAARAAAPRPAVPNLPNAPEVRLATGTPVPSLGAGGAVR